MNRTTAVLVASIACAASFTLVRAQAGLLSTAATHHWEFRTGKNPAPPETATAGAATAQAVIAPGDFSSAWRSASPGFGVAEGIWDLGSSGVITLNTAAPEAGASEARLLTVRVVQYQDGAIYDQLVRVTVPGASAAGSTTRQAFTTPLGEWTLAESQWRMAAGTTADRVVITGAETGSLIDAVTIATRSSTEVAGLQLTIRRAGEKLELSWPATYDQAVLESNEDLSDTVGWTAVAAPAEVKDGMRTVTVDPIGTARFYRLK